MIDNIFNNKLNSLSENDRKLLIDWLIDSLTPEHLNAIEIRNEILSATGVECVFCKHEECVLHQAGIRTRYRCRECRRTFRSTSGTVLQGIHHTEKWKHFIPLLLESRTIREVAKILEISTRTAFDWRHKALSALAEINWTQEFNGVIELKETMHKLSFKGSRPDKIDSFKENSHIGDLNFTENQISVITVHERLNNRTEMQVIQRGSVNVESLSTKLNKRIKNIKLLILNGEHENIKNWALQEKIRFVSTNQEQQPTHVSLSTIRNLKLHESTFLGWVVRFKGIASKYLNNYLNWHNLLSQLFEYKDKLTHTFGRLLQGNTSISRYRNLDTAFIKMYLSPNFAT